MMPEAHFLQRFTQPMLAWYDRNKRVLPWREDPAAYHVWISEIMLQQTRVEAVKPYYFRFIEALPDVKSLACCEDDRLLKLWEGLGYYSRARNLKKAAITITERFDGSIPGTYNELIKLPGIGSYTAGAISSIAFGEAKPAVDGNVLRVISRLLASKEDISLNDTKKHIFEILSCVIPKDRPGDFNQALMEIGALVCLPGRPPECEKCPLSGSCISHIHGLTGAIPVKSPARKRKIEKRTVLIIRDGLYSLIRKRPDTGLLSGMYEPLVMEGWHSQEEVIDFLQSRSLDPVRVLMLPDAKHIFTHIEWQMKGYMILVQDLEHYKDGNDLFASAPEMIALQYPIPTAYSAYTEYLKVSSGYERVIDYYNTRVKRNGGFHENLNSRNTLL